MFFYSQQKLLSKLFVRHLLGDKRRSAGKLYTIDSLYNAE